MTAGELHDVLAGRGAALMVRRAAPIMARGTLDCTPQPADGVTYAAKIDKGETRIDFARPAREVHNHVRACRPSPGAWFEAAPRGSERVRLLRTARGAAARAAPPRHRAGPARHRGLR